MDVGDDNHQAPDLRRALAAIARSQGAWLRDLRSTCTGDPDHLAACHRWLEQLTLLKLHLLRAEERLLHYLRVPARRRAPADLVVTAPDFKEAFARWDVVVPPYLQGRRLDTAYRRLDISLDPLAEDGIGDISTDLVIVAAVATCTAPALERLDESVADDLLEELAFYRVVSPWKVKGNPALRHVLRWLDEYVDEHSML